MINTAFAYTLLQALPGNKTEVSGLSDYLSWLFTFALAAAAFLAVLQIVIGGLQIISGGASETARSNAKKRIQDALWGLLLAFSAVLILETISPGQFTNLSLSITPVTIEAPAEEATTPTTGLLTGGCDNCVNLSSLGSEIKFQIKSTACSGGVNNCYLNGDVVQDLNKLVTEAETLGLSASSWRVTEGYPPTVTHLDSCHYNGTCVDIALMPGTATQESVAKFIQAANAAGFRVTNEYSGYGGTTFTTTTSDCLHVEI